METGRTKRIVVIRDIPSNMIEEAILILKAEPEAGQDKGAKGNNTHAKKKDNDFLLKEAESIINNYIKECKAKGIYTNETVKKAGFPKNKLAVNIAINLALVGSIALLVLLFVKII